MRPKDSETFGLDDELCGLFNNLSGLWLLCGWVGWVGVGFLLELGWVGLSWVGLSWVGWFGWLLAWYFGRFYYVLSIAAAMLRNKTKMHVFAYIHILCEYICAYKCRFQVTWYSCVHQQPCPWP